MAEIHQQKRPSIVLALTDHDLGREGQIEIDVTDSSEELATDIEDSVLHSPLTDGSGRGADIAAVQIPKERRVSISKRLKRQKITAKTLEDRLQQTMRDRRRMIDSLFDEHTDLNRNLRELEVIARDKVVDNDIRRADEERATKSTQIKDLDKRIKAASNDRQAMIQQLVSEQKQINQSIHELEELAAGSKSTTSEKRVTDVQPNLLRQEGCHQPQQKAISMYRDRNHEGGRTRPGLGQIGLDRPQDTSLHAHVKKDTTGRHHADAKDKSGHRPTTKKGILPMTIMRLL